MSKHCWTLKDRHESQFSAAFYPILLSDTKRAEIIHRALQRYCNGTDTSYTVVIRGKDIPFVLARDGYRYKHDDEIADENTIGVDVNSKHNMFALSNGEFIPHDEALIADLQTIENQQLSTAGRFC